MNSFKTLGLWPTLLLLAACAKLPPDELVDARAAMAHAQNNSHAALVPAEMHKAQVALQTAEASFEEDGDSYQTRDLSYVAHRKAQLASSQANTANAEASLELDRKKTEILQASYLERSKADLASSNTQPATSDAERAAADFRAFNAELRAASAVAELAAAQEEARGMVITLSGSVLFRSGESQLLPTARDRLDKVVDALLTAPTRHLLVEGHTDSDGSDSSNLALSQARADAVRMFFIDRGYAPRLVGAKGIGEGRPIADNNTQEGKSNNRRVEIIVHPPGHEAGASNR
jgi:outer membrane protein OmpA-like peptidoglycan-associated protein